MRILAEAQHLRKRGFTVEIACQPDSQIIRYANNMGITTHAIRMRSIYDVSAVIKFMRLLRQRKIKILNTHSSIDSYLASIAARLIGGIKIVRSRHLDIPTKSKFIYKFPHRIITTGESIRKDIISRNYVSADRVISIPTGVDTKRFNPILYDRNKVRAELGISANIPLIGMIAFTRIMKGYPFFLEAAEKVLKEIPQAMFLVVGSGPPGREQELKELAVRLGIENSVKFTGFREDIPEVLSALDVFVLSSIHSEGVPQALLQALLMEKPVVATNVGSISEAVIDNKTGVLVSSRNSLALAEGILKILRKPDFKLEIAKAGRKLIEEKFTLNQMVDKIEKVYCELH